MSRISERVAGGGFELPTRPRHGKYIAEPLIGVILVAGEHGRL
jgi:hypothetical protein